MAAEGGMKRPAGGEEGAGKKRCRIGHSERHEEYSNTHSRSTAERGLAADDDRNEEGEARPGQPCNRDEDEQATPTAKLIDFLERLTAEEEAGNDGIRMCMLAQRLEEKVMQKNARSPSEHRTAMAHCIEGVHGGGNACQYGHGCRHEGNAR